MLLTASLENAEQDALGTRPGRSTVAAPHLAGDHHGANGLLGAPVGGLQAGTVQESEQCVALPAEVVGQAPIARGTVGAEEQTIHLRFQTATGHRQPVCADLALVAPRTQSQRRLQNLLHRPRKMRHLASADFDHLPAAAQQMGQAGLMRGLRELPIDTPSIPHQNPVKSAPNIAAACSNPRPG